MGHYRYEQRVSGYPVYGADVVVHVGKDNTVKSASANVLPSLRVSLRAKLSRASAISKAKVLWRAKYGSSQNLTTLSAKQYIYAPALINNDASTDAYLVWEVKLVGGAEPSIVTYLLDARTGELKRFDDGVRHLDRRIADCSALPGSNLCHVDYWMFFPPSTNYAFGRSEFEPERGPNPRFLPEISTDTDTLYNLFGQAMTYYQTKFNRNGANDQGGTANGITAPVTRSWGSPYADFLTSWEGLCPNNARFNAGRIYFCKGSVVDDVFAHELGHGLPYYSIREAGTNNPLGMVYEGESGALDENQADVLAEMFERWKNGNNDWIFGTGLVGGSFRSLKDPPSLSPIRSNYSPPDRFHSDNFYCGTENFGGVHRNSTVPSKAAYLMSQGGWFNGCTISPIGADKVEQIWYRTVTRYFQRVESFNSAFHKFIQSCRDLYDTEPTTCAQVERALQAVEMDQPGKCSGLQPTLPACVDIM